MGIRHRLRPALNVVEELGGPFNGRLLIQARFPWIPRNFLCNKQEVEYRSGPWNGIRFSGVPEMAPLNYLSFDFVMDQHEVYYSYSTTNASLISRLVVNATNGYLQRFAWIESCQEWNLYWYAPKDQCDSYGECGPYGICDTNASPVCRCMKGFGRPRIYRHGI
jgi:hypothetical protein